MIANRHPVDELADVRVEIKRLKDREDELRDKILAGECDLLGDQFEASIREVESERLDVSALKREVGLEKLRPFMKQSKAHVIRVLAREQLEDVG